MTVIPRKRRNRIPLTGLLHTFLRFLPTLVLAAALPGGALAAGEDVPFVTTPDNVTAAMLELAGVKAGDHVIDLGSGDGRIVIAAARRGATGLGVEIDPRLVAESVANAVRAGVSARARFLEQDLFKTDLSPATVVTMYLLPEVNLQLRPAILALRPGTRIVSHDWDMGDWAPDRTLTIPVPDKPLGLRKSSFVHLWIVPARVAGLWCGSDGERVARLRLRASFQEVQGTLEAAGASPASVAGRIDGASVSLEARGANPDGSLALVVLAEGSAKTAAATGSLAAAAGLGWRRAAGETCRP
jgi:SAM-dependent methyltransferase